MIRERRIEITKPKPSVEKPQFVRRIPITKFASDKERIRYGELYKMLCDGIIDHLQYKVPYKLMVASPVNGGLIHIATFTATFTYYDLRNSKIVEDASAAPFRRTSAYNLQKRLMKQLLDIEVREV